MMQDKSEGFRGVCFIKIFVQNNQQSFQQKVSALFTVYLSLISLKGQYHENFVLNETVGA